MSQQPSSHSARGMQVALAAAMLYGCSGCAAVHHHLHQHGPAALTGDHHADYYHCPECGRIEPKSKHHHVCGPRVVLPFFGHQPTCWRPWPAGWIGCPPCSEPVETILYDQPLVIPAEVIPAPPPPTIGPASAAFDAAATAPVENTLAGGAPVEIAPAESALGERAFVDSTPAAFTAATSEPAALAAIAGATDELRLAERERSRLRALTAGGGQQASHPAPVVQIAAPMGWDVER